MPDKRLNLLGTLPRFVTVSGSVEEFTALGFEDFVTLDVRRARVEVNYAGKWGSFATASTGPAIDWTTQTYDDDNDDSTAEVAGGYGIATGGSNDDVVVKMSNYVLGGGADLLVLGIGEFVHLRGSAYFEMGQTLTVPLAGVVDDAALAALGPDVARFAGVNEKELRFLTFGGQDLYAFIGVGGPHWLTEDESDLSSDVRFECDPGAAGCVPATDDDPGSCGPDSKPLDGFAEAESNPLCRAMVNPNAVGIAVSDLDFAFAMGTPTLQVDPTRYYTLRARIDDAGLIGLESEGLVARLRGVTVEVNVATPTVGAFPLLPVIDWKAHALASGCDQAAVDALLGGGTPSGDCEPFGVRTGRVVAGQDVREYFLYDGLYVRAAVRLAQIDLFGVLVARGSLALVLGPVTDVVLTDGTPVTGVTTMTIGGSDLYGFLGSDGPHWVEDPDTEEILYTDDGTVDGEVCLAGSAGCTLVRNPDAVGLALSKIDFGVFIGAKLDPQAPAAYVAAKVSFDGLDLVGVPGVVVTGMLALSLNLGFALGGSTSASIAGISFGASFPYTGSATDGVDGFLLDTGNPDAPLLLDYESTFLQVQLTGAIEIRAGPEDDAKPLVRIDGIFFLGVGLDAGAESFRLLALGEMTVGPDIGSDDPLLSIGAVGVLVLDQDGVAGDFTVNLQAGGPLSDVLSLSVYARVVFNTAGKDMTVELPEELSGYLTDLGTSSVKGVSNPGRLADALIDRLEPCGDLLCYTISGRSPNLVSGTGPDDATIAWLLGDGPKPDLSGQDLEPYLVAVVDGRLTLVGFASATVFGAIRIADSEFELIADLQFELGTSRDVGLMVDVSAIAEISSAGFYLQATVDLEANLLSVFDLDVSGTLTIDTRGSSTAFELGLSGSVNVLNVVRLNATIAIKVGGALGEDAWYFGATVEGSFGPLSLKGGGFVSSWGSFSFDLSGSVDLSIAGTGIEGGLSAHLSYCARVDGASAYDRRCADDIRTDILDGTVDQAKLDLIHDFQTEGGPLNAGGRTFVVALDGRVAVKIIGITLAGVGVGVEAAGVLGGLVQVRATFTVETIFGDISRTVTIATFQLPTSLVNGRPKPPVLATVDPADATVLLLNVGDRAGNREVRPLEEDEDYTITQSGGVVTVSAFGWTESFTGITHISGDFGSGRDSLTVFPSVTASVTATGGAGDDRLAHAGSGVADLSGGDGDDVLIGGLGADTLRGGAGDDFLDGGPGVDLMYGGEGDDTFFGFGHQMAGETLDPGEGYDRMEVVGRDTGETITLDAVGTDLQLDYDGAGTTLSPLVLTGIDELLLRLSGSDALTVQGDVRTQLAVLTVTSAPYRSQQVATQADVDAKLAAKVGDVIATALASNDSITLVLDDAAVADTVVISSAMSAAPKTFSQGDGVFGLASTNGRSVATTTVRWTSAGFLFTIANTGLTADDHDLLTIRTGGGTDDVAVRSLLTDLALDLGDGDDVVVVGSAADCSAGTCTNAAGTVDRVLAPLRVTAGAGTDRLDVEDTTDTTGDALLVTSGLVSGLDMHPTGIRYSGLEQLDVRTGSGADLVSVRSTSAVTTIESRGGDDVFHVSSDAPADLGSLDGIAFALTLLGGNGARHRAPQRPRRQHGRHRHPDVHDPDRLQPGGHHLHRVRDPRPRPRQRGGPPHPHLHRAGPHHGPHRGRRGRRDAHGRSGRRARHPRGRRRRRPRRGPGQRGDPARRRGAGLRQHRPPPARDRRRAHRCPGHRVDRHEPPGAVGLRVRRHPAAAPRPRRAAERPAAQRCLRERRAGDLRRRHRQPRAEHPGRERPRLLRRRLRGHHRQRRRRRRRLPGRPALQRRLRHRRQREPLLRPALRPADAGGHDAGHGVQRHQPGDHPQRRRGRRPVPGLPEQGRPHAERRERRRHLRHPHVPRGGLGDAAHRGRRRRQHLVRHERAGQHQRR